MDYEDNIQRVIRMTLPEGILQTSDPIGLTSIENTLDRTDYEPAQQENILLEEFQSNLENEVWEFPAEDLYRLAHREGWLDTEALRRILFYAIIENVYVSITDETLD